MAFKANEDSIDIKIQIFKNVDTETSDAYPNVIDI